MNIASLLTGPPEVDILPLIERLHLHGQQHGSVRAPAHIHDSLSSLASILPAPADTPSTPKKSYPRVFDSATSHPTISYDVRATRKTVLQTLYTYNEVNVYVEYPESGEDKPVGYRFRLDPTHWTLPSENFVYSFGKPGGQTIAGDLRYTKLLQDSQGKNVPCVSSHYTCLGSKICSYADRERFTKPHSAATRQDIFERLTSDAEHRQALQRPKYHVFERTAALITGLRHVGCHAGEWKTEDIFEEQQAARRTKFGIARTKKRPGRCDGHIVFELDENSQPCLQCKYFDRDVSQDHHFQAIDSSHLDIEYLEAVFMDDTAEIERIEEEAYSDEYGPLVDCTTVANFTSKREHCPFDHRNPDTSLLEQGKLEVLPCSVKIHMFEPLEQYREQCPYVLVFLQGTHQHPPPLPTKTPPLLRQQIFSLFGDMGGSVASLTPRRFIQHEVVTAYVAKCFPDNPTAKLADIHISLANQSHLAMYIRQAKQDAYPEGTGWKGMLNLYQIETETYPVEARYIRKYLTVDARSLAIHPEDEDWSTADGEDMAKVIICMAPEGSRRMCKSQYIQFDVSYKRVARWHEFEIGAWDRMNRMSVVFARVFITRQTAELHKLIFEEINSLVEMDTKSRMRWRHLNAVDLDDFEDSVLLVTIDQGGGQAKGFGLFLQARAQCLPSSKDLHEHTRLRSDLGPYEHLHRIVRLCIAHFFRNIRELKAPRQVREAMRSLYCLEMTEEVWEATLQLISTEGGKVGHDWVQNKIVSKFAFQAICWQRSLVPRIIWVSGDRTSNIIEILHQFSYHNGKHLTLVGGIETGYQIDYGRFATANAIEDLGVRPYYQTGHPSENMARNVRRNYLARKRILKSQDDKIASYNARAQKALKDYQGACEARDTNEQKFQILITRESAPTQTAYDQAKKAKEKAAMTVQAMKGSFEAVMKLQAGLPAGSGCLKLVLLTLDVQS